MSVSVKANGGFWLFGMGSAGKPGEGSAPSAPTLTTCTATEDVASLLWKAPADDGGSPISQYAIYQSTDEKTWKVVKTVGGLITNASIPGLTFGTTYFFYVTASNAVGQSKPSNSMSVTPKTDYNIVEGGNIIHRFTIGGIKYRCHQFTATGTLTVKQATTPFDVYVTGGGAGGGFGGGGAGAYVEKKGISITVGGYQATVGAAGKGGTGNAGGANGGTSSFPNLTAATGGGGGAANGDSPRCTNGNDGACGGGGRANTDCTGGAAGGRGLQGFKGGDASGWTAQFGAHSGGGGGVSTEGKKDADGGQGVYRDFTGQIVAYGFGGAAPGYGDGTGNGGGGQTTGGNGGVFVVYPVGPDTVETRAPEVEEIPGDVVNVAVLDSDNIVTNIVRMLQSDVPLLAGEGERLVEYDVDTQVHIGLPYYPDEGRFALCDYASFGSGQLREAPWVVLDESKF